MKIMIDFTQIPLDRTGVGIYADHLVTQLLPLLREGDSLVVVAQSDDASIRRLARSHPAVGLVTVPARLFRNRALLMVFEQVLLPLIAWEKRVDLLHSLHYTHPLLPFTRRMVTVHDLTFVLFPELHTRGRRWVMPFFIRRAMKHAEGVIFVSAATQRDAERLFGGGNNLRAAVPLGVSPAETSFGEESSSGEVLSRLKVNKPYLLFVGTIEPRKNLVRIVQAFEVVAKDRPELTLVLAGKYGWHTGEIVAAMENSAVRSRICPLGFVSELEKSVLLSNCAMLVYPSLYEGFGLPILEGMAAGAPVITSTISSMPEVAGDAALLVDPTSVEDIAAAMEQILGDETLAQRLRHAGPAQAASFTWERTAGSTYEAYRRAVAGR